MRIILFFVLIPLIFTRPSKTNDKPSKLTIQRFQKTFLNNFGPPQHGIYELKDWMNPEDTQKRGRSVIAVGDFDHDFNTDLMTVDDNRTFLEIFRYNVTNFPNYQFIEGSYDRFWDFTSDKKILGVIPGDFNFDGRTDFLMTVEKDNNTVEFHFMEYRAHCKEKLNFTLAANGIIEAPYQQPMVLDINGEREISILYFDEQKNRQVKTYKANNTNLNQSKFFNQSFEEFVYKPNKTTDPVGYDKCITDGSWKNFPIKTPNSNAVADFNGDCKADLFIETWDSTNSQIWFEFWIKEKITGKYCLVQHEKAHDCSETSLFLDTNNNGNMDLLVLDKNLTIHFYYNKNPGQKAGTGGKLCSMYTLEKPYVNMETIWPMYYENESHYVEESLIKDSFFKNGSNVSLYYPNKYTPPKMRYGDLNLDGMMDLFITIKIKGVNQTEKGMSVIFTNMATGDNTDEQFNIQTKNYKIMYRNDTEYAFYFDIAEMGKMSIIQMTHDGGYTKLRAYMNYLNSKENLYLKALGYNGQFPDLTENSGKMTGALYYGITYQAEVALRNGTKVLAYQTVLSRSGYTPLDQTFVYFGLNNTNNYVSNFYVTMPLNKQYQKMWQPIIPNSRLVMYPANKTSNWVLKYKLAGLLKKKQELTAYTVVFLLILGGWIIHLWRIEQKEDQIRNIDVDTFFE